MTLRKVHALIAATEHLLSPHGCTHATVAPVGSVWHCTECGWVYVTIRHWLAAITCAA